MGAHMFEKKELKYRPVPGRPTMAIAGSRLALIIVLVIAGLYFLIDHKDPLPLNHESLGLGMVHLAHAVFGIVLVAGAVVLWRRSRTVASTTPHSTAVGH